METTGTTRWSVRNTKTGVIHRIEGTTFEQALLGLDLLYSDDCEVEAGTHVARVVFVHPTNGGRLVLDKFIYQANN
jgi:hypothetical protein